MGVPSILRRVCATGCPTSVSAMPPVVSRSYVAELAMQRKRTYQHDQDSKENESLFHHRWRCGKQRMFPWSERELCNNEEQHQGNEQGVHSQSFHEYLLLPVE